tara:strand:- start:641 stop:895 length:255 start_codon:yes stop_codon:yes gene_type:complete
MKNKIKRLLDWLYDYAWLLVIATLLIAPLVLPTFLVFHPLLVVPYYGILWWTANIHYLTYKLTFSRSAAAEEKPRIKKKKEKKK